MPWAPRWQLKSSENTAFYCGGVAPERAAGSTLSVEIQERESMTFQGLRWTQCQIEVHENFNFLLWVWGIGWMKREKEGKKKNNSRLWKKKKIFVPGMTWMIWPFSSLFSIDSCSPQQVSLSLWRDAYCQSTLQMGKKFFLCLRGPLKFSFQNL